MRKSRCASSTPPRTRPSIWTNCSNRARQKSLPARIGFWSHDAEQPFSQEVRSAAFYRESGVCLLKIVIVCLKGRWCDTCVTIPVAPIPRVWMPKCWPLITKARSLKKRCRRPRIISSLARVAGESRHNLRPRRPSANYEIRKMNRPFAERYRRRKIAKCTETLLGRAKLPARQEKRNPESRIFQRRKSGCCAGLLQRPRLRREFCFMWVLAILLRKKRNGLSPPHRSRRIAKTTRPLGILLRLLQSRK